MGGFLSFQVSDIVIARDLRLRSPLEFEKVRSSGQSWSNRLLVLVVAANELGHNRYGFAVGRQIQPVVRRNRVKRLMREATRQLHPEIAPGHDLIWIARNRTPRDMKTPQMFEAQRDLLGRSGILVSHDANAQSSTV